MRHLHALVCASFCLVMGPAVAWAEVLPQDQTPVRDPGCDVPRGYDCATPGFERPLTLTEAEALSMTETVVYLYGPGIQAARLAADVMRTSENGAVPTIAAPGAEVPADTLYVVILGHVIKHRESGEPVAFYQRFLNRGEIFSLTRVMHARILAGE